MKIPSHITIDETAGDAGCSVCGQGVNVSGVTGRGWLQPADMLATFVVAHATHTRKGSPSGLTPTGRPSSAALATLRDATA